MPYEKDIISQYFTLSDQASKDPIALKKIIDFFAEGAIITAADGSKITTHKQLVDFFQKFFHRNQQLKHIFKISDQDEHYQTEWAVAGQKQDHTLFALHGFDTYTFNASHKISQLKVTVL